ncbi:MAG: ATP-dependent DNA helicase RecG [Ruminococcaceae bacterium]|nr:ATP-dependent DNA helicase RecG [Oscillospiraceae bacterium]
MDINTDIKYLKGVGSARAAEFNKLGVDTVDALLHFYPRNYEDWSKIVSIKDAPIDENCCIRAIVSHVPTKHLIKGGRTLYKVSVTDGKGMLNLTFFNNKYIPQMLKENEEYLFYGKVLYSRIGVKEMLSPMFIKAEQNEKIRPIYHATAKLSSRTIEKCVTEALKHTDEIVKDPLPEEMRKKYRLCTLKEALFSVHFPVDNADLEKGRRRLIFDELFYLQMGLIRLKDKNRETENRHILQRDYSGEFIRTLPFELTNAQKRSIAEAIGDMSGEKMMNRLLQGDVGSGKTAVAAALIYAVAKNKMQSALMAPTEVLAEQHLRTFEKMFKNTDIKVELLTGSTKAKEKREIKQRLKSGETDLVIGTHAIIQQDVEFNNIGFVVTDEQHRFGVNQRTVLRDKGESPHVLVMSATPIPRTLALIIYGDLDVSVLDEMPLNRKKTETYFVTGEYHERIYNFIKKHLDSGLQAFIVCPLVNEGESDLIPAKEYYEKLSTTVFRGYRLGLLHGQMKGSEKEKIMRSFAENEIQLLVSTVVIEVGIDVPNAALIVIENAERFGLSQLHQLRGRVGRGSEKSTCILVSDSQSENAKQRFDIMCKTTDGFKIADEDLKMRGPGDFFGSKQHGLPSLKIASLLTDNELLMLSRTAAAELLEDDFDMKKKEHIQIRHQVNRLFSQPSI